MEDGFSGTWCNSLFRMAVTAAKKVKTETKLSGISVSTATLAVKAAEMYFGSLENRKILVIGATGKIGQIMMKNIAADHHVQLYAASRQLKSGEKAVLGTDTLSDGHGTRHQQTEEYVQIAYADRYRLANEMDVIISATASPHYTLTKEGWQSGVIQKRRRILIDMAVPMDIEAGIEDEENSLCHLDELTSLSEKNQHLRFEAADRAREVRMMKAEKGSEIITTICEYENSVAMPDNERLTYLDTCGIAHIKDGNGNVKAQEAYANRCSEYLRFGHEVDLAACGAYSPYDALKVCDTPEIFLKTGFEQRPMLYTQKHLFQALTPKSDYNPHRHGFSIEQVKRFPELLASPVVLANSPTREDVLLAILLATDAYDTPLIAGIKPDGTGNYGEREVETNMVLSVYSRQNFIRYFALLRDMDAFVFVSGRKIEALEDLSGLPLAENCSGLDIDRILQRPKCLG